MPSVLNKHTNYATMLAVNASESGRTSSTVIPTAGQTFSSANSTKIEFLIPPISYLDGSASYLRWNAQINAQLGATVADDVYVAWDGMGATSWIDSIQIYNAENQLITEVRDFSQLACHLIETKGLEYVSTVGSQAMGYDPIWSRVTEHVTGANKECFIEATQQETGQALASTAATIYPLSGSASGRYTFPGLVYIPVGVQQDAKILADSKAKTVQFALPLSFLSGIFDTEAYLPLRLMGNRAHALRVDINMKPAVSALSAFSGVLATGTYSSTNAGNSVAQLSLGYTLSQMEMVVEYVNISDEADRMITEAVNSGSGVHILFSDWSTKRDTSWTAGSFYTALTPKYTISLKNLVCQVRDAAKLNVIGQEPVTGCRRYGLTTAQAKIGAQFWPNAPINLANAGYNGSAYLEYSKCASGLDDVEHQLYAPNYNSAAKAGFSIGFDFDRKDKCHDEEGYSMSGKDTRSGSSSIQVIFNRDDSAVALDNTRAARLDLTYLFHTDNVLVLERGMAFPLERT